MGDRGWALMTRGEFVTLIEPLLEELGYELVQVQLTRARRRYVIKVFAERLEGGMAIADCVLLSRRITELLDQQPLMQGMYTLEVSSPGMNRPIWRPAHYERFRGEKVHLLLAEPMEGRRRWVGHIQGMAEDGRVIVVLEGLGEQRLRLEEIQEARLEMDPWKSPGRPGPLARGREQDRG
jgi:ribosome maturation factor RimP